MEPPNITFPKDKAAMENKVLTIEKGTALCCTQNRQARLPGCRQLWATAGLRKTRRNLTSVGNLLSEEQGRMHRPPPPSPLFDSPMSQVGRWAEWDKDRLVKSGELASESAIRTGNQISFLEGKMEKQAD